MTFAPAFLADLRDAVPVEEVAARFTTLKRAGRELKGLSPFNQERSPSFYVIPQKRMFHDFSSGKSGDVFALLMDLDGLTFPEAVEEVARLAGIPMPSARPRDARRAAEVAQHQAARQAEHMQRQEARDAIDARDKERRRVEARAVWDAARPLPGTIGARYLERRGVGFGAELPTLRFHPSLEHHAEETGEVTRWPALVAAVQAPSRRFLAVWRIYLTPEGEKAPVRPAKRGLGSYTDEGGSVWLGPPSETANACEGIETGLGVFGLLGRRQGVQAALSTSGIVNFLPPPPAKRTLLWPDGDTDRIKVDPRTKAERKTPSPGLTACHKRLSVDQARGWPCAIQPPPTIGRDFLDVYNASKAHLTDE